MNSARPTSSPCSGDEGPSGTDTVSGSPRSIAGVALEHVEQHELRPVEPAVQLEREALAPGRGHRDCPWRVAEHADVLGDGSDQVGLGRRIEGEIEGPPARSERNPGATEKIALGIAGRPRAIGGQRHSGGEVGIPIGAAATHGEAPSAHELPAACGRLSAGRQQVGQEQKQGEADAAIHRYAFSHVAVRTPSSAQA
jgi:hypothetical protein